MSRASLSILKTTFTTADRLGATIPKPVRAEYDRLVEQVDKVNHLDIHHDVPGAVLAALADGTDPAAHPDVQREVTRRALAETAPAVQTALYARAEAFSAEHADTIIDSFRRPFDQAAETITQQLHLLGPVDLDDAPNILKRGGDAAAQWTVAHEADRVIADIRQTWGALTGVGGRQADRRYLLLVIADIPAADFLAQIGLSNAPDMRAWDIARKGWPLSLATPSTLAERIAGLHGEQAAGQRRQQAAAQDATRSRFGSGGPFVPTAA